MKDIFILIKKLVNFLVTNRSLLYPSMFIFIMFIYNFKNISQTLPNYLTTNNKKLFFNTFTFQQMEQKNILRSLIEVDAKNKNGTNENIQNEYKNISVKELVKRYEFIKNISRLNYFGDWKELKINKNNFIEKSGAVFFTFGLKKEENNFLNLGREKNTSNISVSISLFDGEYVDNMMDINFSFPINNYDKLLNDLFNNSIEIIKINLENITISYTWGQFVEMFKKVDVNITDISIEITKKKRYFKNKMSHEISSTNFAKIKMNIKTKFSNNYKNMFAVKIEGEAYSSSRYSNRILNYSMILTLLGLIEIYYSVKFLLELAENNQMALNLDMLSVVIQIMWCSIICAVNFYRSLSNESLTYEYGMPSMTYFGLFSIFQLRILFVAWRARNTELMYRDIRQFRKKLFKFYIMFYIILFATLISIKIWYTYFAFTVFLFVGTWIFQIIHSYKTSTKPPMNFKYIFIVTFIKILICFYLKGYYDNLFSFRPNFWKVLSISIILIVEVIILCLQKILGPKFFVPEQYRAQGYDYYKDETEISDEMKEQECIICLESLRKINAFAENENNNNEILNDFGDGNQENEYFNKIVNYLKKLKRKKYKKPYMVTPCHHSFHSYCLERWLDVKNECPYCRNKIPPLDS